MGGASHGARSARGQAGVGLSAQARVSPPRGFLGVSGLPGTWAVADVRGGRRVAEVLTLVRTGRRTLQRGAWGGGGRPQPAQVASPPSPGGGRVHPEWGRLWGLRANAQEGPRFGGWQRSPRGLHPRRCRRGRCAAGRTERRLPPAGGRRGRIGTSAAPYMPYIRDRNVLPGSPAAV